MADQGLLFADGEVPPAGYQMQSWDASAACTCPISPRHEAHRPRCPYPSATRSWVPMENGPGGNHWRPVADPRAAVRHAAAWSGAACGFGGIPAMQVVDLGTGRVIWRSSEQYPDAGPPIEPSWQAAVYAAIRGELAERTSSEGR